MANSVIGMVMHFNSGFILYSQLAVLPDLLVDYLKQTQIQEDGVTDVEFHASLSLKFCSIYIAVLVLHLLGRISINILIPNNDIYKNIDRKKWLPSLTLLWISLVDISLILIGRLHHYIFAIFLSQLIQGILVQFSDGLGRHLCRKKRYPRCCYRALFVCGLALAGALVKFALASKFDLNSFQAQVPILLLITVLSIIGLLINYRRHLRRLCQHWRLGFTRKKSDEPSNEVSSNDKTISPLTKNVSMLILTPIQTVGNIYRYFSSSSPEVSISCGEIGDEVEEEAWRNINNSSNNNINNKIKEQEDEDDGNLPCDYFIDLQVPSRYIKGCRSYEDSLTRWRNTLRYRRQNQIDAILTHPQRHFELIKEHFKHYIHGSSKSGNPVLFILLGESKLSNLLASGVGKEKLVMYIVFWLEYILTNIIYDRETGKVVVVVDVKDAKIVELSDKNILEVIRSLCKILQDHYIERCHRILLLNTPYFMQSLWQGVVSPLLSKSTTSKVVFVPIQEQNKSTSPGVSKHVQPMINSNATQLQEVIPLNQLPRRFGGNGVALGEDTSEINYAIFVRSLNVKNLHNISSTNQPRDNDTLESNIVKNLFQTSSCDLDSSNRVKYESASNGVPFVDNELAASVASITSTVATVTASVSSSNGCTSSIDHSGVTFLETGHIAAKSKSSTSNWFAPLKMLQTTSKALLRVSHRFLGNNITNAHASEREAFLGQKNAYIFDEESRCWILDDNDNDNDNDGEDVETKVSSNDEEGLLIYKSQSDHSAIDNLRSTLQKEKQMNMNKKHNLDKIASPANKISYFQVNLDGTQSNRMNEIVRDKIDIHAWFTSFCNFGNTIGKNCRVTIVSCWNTLLNPRQSLSRFINSTECLIMLYLLWNSITIGIFYNLPLLMGLHHGGLSGLGRGAEMASTGLAAVGVVEGITSMLLAGFIVVFFLFAWRKIGYFLLSYPLFATSASGIGSIYHKLLFEDNTDGESLSRDQLVLQIAQKWRIVIVQAVAMAALVGFNISASGAVPCDVSSPLLACPVRVWTITIGALFIVTIVLPFWDICGTSHAAKFCSQIKPSAYSTRTTGRQHSEELSSARWSVTPNTSLLLQSGHINPNVVFASQLIGVLAFSSVYATMYAAAIYTESDSGLSYLKIKESISTQSSAAAAADTVLYIPLIVSTVILLVVGYSLLYIRIKEI